MYLQRRQNYPGDIDLGDEDIAGDLSDVLQETQVQVLILQPGQLQVAVDVGAVGVPVPQVAVVVLPVAGHRHPAGRADADWKKIRNNLQQSDLNERSCFDLFLDILFS